MTEIFYDKFKKLILILTKRLDSENKFIGRPIIYKYDFCIETYINQLKTGNSWRQLEYLKNKKLDSVRKRINKWINLGIFNKAYNILLKIYNKKFKKNNLFIDSTVIVNFSGSLNFGYNIKIKNKKSIKISALVDDNKVPHLFEVTPSTPHDAKIMEKIIETNNFKNKEINLIGDKGYIKNEIYKNIIKSQNNISLITPKRINAKDQFLDDIETKLLKKRTIIENFFALIKKSYYKISKISDKNETSYYNKLYTVSCLIILKFVNFNN